MKFGKTRTKLLVNWFSQLLESTSSLCFACGLLHHSDKIWRWCPICLPISRSFLWRLSIFGSDSPNASLFWTHLYPYSRKWPCLVLDTRAFWDGCWGPWDRACLSRPRVTKYTSWSITDWEGFLTKHVIHCLVSKENVGEDTSNYPQKCNQHFSK